jgi:isopenicillin-N N-acyltransferase-like protein
MTYVFRSTASAPRERGREFGALHAARIRKTVDAYSAFFARLAGAPVELEPFGAAALAAVRAQAPALCEEMEGIAEGAGLGAEIIGALNARTEILACLKARLRGECSAVVHVEAAGSAPIALQNWDWYEDLADNWLVWEIPHADGSMTTTFTEFGIVGKIGINSHGIGLLFTILHHAADGARIGMPVHAAARLALDNGRNINRAMTALAAADVSASSSLTLVSTEAGARTAVSVELYPGGPGFVFPDARGVLVHTNHFLAEEARAGDQEAKAFPDTLLRRDILLRGLHRIAQPTLAQALSLIGSRVGGEGAVCSLPDRSLGNDPQSVTVATVILDFESRSLQVIEGGYRG